MLSILVQNNIKIIHAAMVLKDNSPKFKEK